MMMAGVTPNVCAACSSLPSDQRCRSIYGVSIPCAASAPETEWSISHIPIKYHRDTTVAAMDASMWVADASAPDGFRPTPVSAPVADSVMQASQLTRLGVVLQWKEASPPDETTSRIPDTVFNASATIDQCACIWATLFQGYHQFQIRDYLEQVGRAWVANYREDAFYYEYVLHQERDMAAPVPLFGLFYNPFSVVLNQLRALASTASAKDSSKLRDLRLIWYDYVMTVCLQYYCLVRSRWLVVDTQGSSFREMNPPFLLMVFTSFDVKQPALSSPVFSTPLHTPEELYAFAMLPDTTFNTLYICVINLINESSLLPDAFRVTRKEMLEEMSTNMWTKLTQERFRQQPIDRFESEVYKAKPSAYRNRSGKEGTGLVVMRPTKMFGEKDPPKGMQYVRVSPRTNDNMFDRTRIVDIFSHMFFSPLDAVFSLSKSDHYAWYAEACGYSAAAVDFSLTSAENAGRDFPRIKHFNDVVAHQLYKFMRVSYQQAYNTLASQMLTRSLAALPTTTIEFDAKLSQGVPSKNIEAANTVMPLPSEARYSAGRPSSSTSQVFHPCCNGSPYTDNPRYPVHAPISSPLGMSAHAFVWMIRTTPASPHLVDGRIVISGVLQPVDDGDRVFLQIRERGVMFRNYMWMPVAGENSYQLLKELYDFFGKWPLAKPISELDSYSVLRIMLLLLRDENKAVRFVWDAFKEKVNGDMRALLCNLQCSYLEWRDEVLDYYDKHVKSKPQSPAAHFLDRVRTEWDGCSAVSPSREVVQLLLSSSAVADTLDSVFKLSEVSQAEDGTVVTQDSPLLMCREAYLARRPVLEHIPRQFQLRVHVKPDLAMSLSPESMLQYMALVIDKVYLDPIRRVCSVLFPEDIVRYGVPAQSLTWHQLAHPPKQRYPRTTALLQLMYNCVSHDAELRTELGDISDRVKRRRLNEPTAEDEAVGDPKVLYTSSSKAATLLFSLLLDKHRAQQQQAFTAPVASLFSKLQDAFDYNRGIPDSQMMVLLKQFERAVHSDLYVYRQVREQTLEHAKDLLQPLVSMPEQVFVEMAAVVRDMLTDKHALPDVRKQQLKDWLVNKVYDTPCVKRLREAAGVSLTYASSNTRINGTGYSFLTSAR
jgi:hypothetical protein